MTLLFSILALVPGLVLGWGHLLLGELAWVLPSLGLVLVLLVARWSPAGRFRTVAVVTGIGLGVLCEGALLVPAIILLVLGSMARATRTFWSLSSSASLVALGFVYALAEAVLLSLFLNDGPATTLTSGGWPWAVGGLLATGIAFAWCDRLPRSHAGIRHALQRP